MIWLKRTHGLDSGTMREIADQAGVSWDTQPIQYRAKGIGYCDGNEDDLEDIQDAAEGLLGYRPQTYDPPERDDGTDTE